MSTPMPNEPIPGSARAKMLANTERMLPGTVRRDKAASVASRMGFALALGLRSKRFKWALRVLTLVLWFACPLWVSGVITVFWIVWMARGVGKGFKWLVSKAPKSDKGLDTCRCHVAE